MKKIRADLLISQKDLGLSREKAKLAIMAGSAFIGTEKIMKPGQLLPEDSVITIKKSPIKYVSRGGLKLEKAIEKYNIDLSHKIAMDIGASTGGFTDCMLREGAKKVYAIDVGYGQLDYSLRQDERVISMERTNIRTLDTDLIKDSLDFISVDVSFISLELVLPVAKKLLQVGGGIVALIKPQFEAGREKVGKKGIIRDNEVHKEVIEKILKLLKTLELTVKGVTFSPITGATGNVEFLVYCSNEVPYVENKVDIEQVIEEAMDYLANN